MYNAVKDKHQKRARRANRTRKTLRGTASRPRLSVFRSSKHISAQVIDDARGVTLASVSDANVEAKGKKPVEIAALVGTELAKRATAAGVTEVVFDRGSYLFHGRVKALAEAAREGGLTF